MVIAQTPSKRCKTRRMPFSRKLLETNVVYKLAGWPRSAGKSEEVLERMPIDFGDVGVKLELVLIVPWDERCSREESSFGLSSVGQDNGDDRTLISDKKPVVGVNVQERVRLSSFRTPNISPTSRILSYRSTVILYHI